MHEKFQQWIRENGIGEVECLVPDMNGVVRGKVLPAQKFLQSIRDNSLRVPSSVYIVAITGHYPDEENKFTTTSDPDVVLQPDFNSICIAPGYRTPTAFVFADAYYSDGKPFEVAPRQVLKNAIELFANKGWTPIMAPELEFYLTQTNTDPDFPLLPPAGRSGRPETSPQPYGLEAITEYDRHDDPRIRHRTA
jgi:glutamine synthetase